MTDLELAAYEYVEARRARVDAGDSGEGTHAQLSQMSADVKARLADLLEEAERHFDNFHDGAPIS